METLYPQYSETMRVFFTAFFGWVLAYPIFCQQLPIFAQYREFSGILNPASLPNDYLWYEKTLSFSGSYRRQWIDAPDGPVTQVLRADYLAERQGTSLLMGGYLLNDRTGRVGMTGAYARLGGVVSSQPSDYGFSFGLQAGIIRYGLDLQGARLRDADDLSVYNTRSLWFPDVGLGVFGYRKLGGYDNLLYGGVSMPQVLGLNLSFRDDQGDLSLKRVRHYYGIAGYKINLKQDYTFIEISGWAKFVAPLPPHFDVNMRYQMSEHFFVGLGLSTSRYFHTEAGVLFGEEKMFRINYGLTASFAQTSAHFGYAHELTISYALER